MSDEECYLKENIKELIEECEDIKLLYLIKSLIIAEKEDAK